MTFLELKKTVSSLSFYSSLNSRGGEPVPYQMQYYNVESPQAPLTWMTPTGGKFK